MSTDKIAVATIEEFIKKVRSSSRSNQKTITMPIFEAETLVHNLNLVLLKLLDKMQDEETKEDNIIKVEMDGGGFEERR